jgi:hypothetical protein
MTPPDLAVVIWTAHMKARCRVLASLVPYSAFRIQCGGFREIDTVESVLRWIKEIPIEG